jgi:branched-subunit amino acid transport protein
MSRQTLIWAVVLAMGASNFAIRFVPVSVVSRLRLPAAVQRWLSFVPVAVLATIVTSEVLRPGGALLAPHTNPYLWAAMPTALVYYRWRSFIGATLVGVGAFLVFRAVLG